MVRKDIDLDAAPRAAQARHRARLPPIVGLLAVRQETGVVAGAVRAAVAQQRRVREVGAELLGRGPEIVHGLRRVGEDVAGWDEDRVGADALAAVGEPEGVIESEGRLVIGEAVEVPVCLDMC